MVDPSRDRRLGEHPRGLLERRGRDERTGLQRCLGDALQHRRRRRRLAPFVRGPGVDDVELAAVDLLADQERGLAGIRDFHLLQHLATDHLDVLVVDLDSLEPVDLLDFVDQVIGQRLDPEHPEDVVRHPIAVHQEVALLDVVALLDSHVLALGQEVLDRLGAGFLGMDDDPPLGLVILAELDAPRGLGDDRVVLGLARFEQLGHPRQAAGDVARLRRFSRDAREHVAGVDRGAVLDAEDRVDRHEVARLETGRQMHHLAILVAERDARAQLGAARLLLPVDHHHVRDAGGVVEQLSVRHPFDHVDIVGDALALGNDRYGVRVPLGNADPRFHLGAVVGEQASAVGHLVPRALAIVLIVQHDLAVAAHHHRPALAVDHHGAVADRYGGVERRFDVRLLGATLRGAADVEGAHGQLRAGLADRLGGDDADRLADVHRRAARKVAAVALAAHAALGFAGQHRADRDRVDRGRFDLLDRLLLDHLTRLDDDFLGAAFLDRGIDDIDRGVAPEDAFGKRRDHVAALDDRPHAETFLGAAVLLDDDAVLGDVDEAAGEVPRVCGLERGVGEPLAGAVGGVEVLQHAQPFLEVRNDRRFDDLARGLGHQAAHAGELLHLRRRAASPRMRHHVDRVERVGAAGFGIDLVAALDACHHLFGDLFRALRPGVDHLVVLFALGDQAVEVLLLELLDLGVGLGDQRLLGGGDDHVVLAERDPGDAGVMVAEAHDPVGEQHGLLLAAMAIHQVDDLGDFLLGQQPVDEVEGNRLVARQDLRQQHPARCRLDHAGRRLAVRIDALVTALDGRMQRHRAGVQRVLQLADIDEYHALAGLALDIHRQVVEPEHDVLRRHDDRLAVGRAEDVVGRHHQHARLELGLERERHVNRHLVAVEVGVERGAHQRMELDRLALDQHRLERLDAKAVQRRRAVQQHRMLADHLLEDVPHLGALLFDHAFGRLDGGRHAVELELRVNERLEQLERHLLGQPALVQLELRADHDHRAPRVIDALAQQVLPEASLLALEHVGQRLERPLVRAGDDAAAAAVVEQRVDRLLQHALLVAHDDVGRAQLDQPLEPVVAVDHAAVEVVEVRGREAAAVERHQRPQLGREHRDDFENQPFGPVARIQQRLDQLETLDDLLALGFRAGLGKLDTQAVALGLEVDPLEDVADRLGADAGRERLLAVLLLGANEVLFAQKLVLFQRREPGLHDHVALEVEDALELLEGHVEKQTDARGQRLEEPDVRHRSRQLDVAHALAPHPRLDHLDPAFFAHDAPVLHALVFAAQAFVVLHRAEDARTEQPVALGLEGAIVDRFRLLDLAEGPRADLFRAGDRDFDLVEGQRLAYLAENLHQLVHLFSLLVGVVAGARPLRRDRQSRCLSSTLRPSACNSLTNTLKLSGMPASNMSSPLTIDS